ncbi:hypothetical protein SARC_04717 [Sphaeroforma arctica JP610]|uniref:Uncharacterized protein n=1 Tax=Sphaeroforma arctica JP610 TaxID=667725 RepID=A0A0L0G1P6_9EUKA|nr:hypothetical protein SARC_04717 [Sphaeroforma arctica JP610]KNC83015.1 hypothetical protein SARC_04717 [Sphaeroforma arctica JP610]|eukprot:XP_014156917.1 hypothetical protein SARC_04717 [Sphaeroforma arctica JP610]
MLSAAFMASMETAGYTPLKTPNGMAAYRDSGSALFSGPDGEVTTRQGMKLDTNAQAFDEFNGPVRMFEGGMAQSDGDGVPIYLDVHNQPWSPPALTIAQMGLESLTYEAAEQTLWANDYLNHTSTTGERLYDAQGLPFFVGPTQELINLVGELAVPGAQSFYLDGTAVTMLNEQIETIALDAYGNTATETVLPYTYDESVLTAMSSAQYTPQTNQLSEAMFTKSGLGVFIGPNEHVVVSSGTDMKAGQVVYTEYAQPMHYYTGDDWSYTNGSPDYLDAFNNPVAVQVNAAPMIRVETMQEMAAQGFSPHFSFYGLAIFDTNGSALFSNQQGDVLDRFFRPCVRGEKVFDMYHGGLRAMDDNMTPVKDNDLQPVWLDAYLDVIVARVNLTALQLDTLTMEEAEAALLKARYEYRYSPNQERLYTKRGYPLFIGPYDSVVDVIGRQAPHHVPVFLSDGSAVPQMTAERLPKVTDSGSVYIDAYWNDVTTPMLASLFSISEETIAEMAANEMRPHTGPSNQLLFDYAGNCLFLDSSLIVHSAVGRVLSEGEVVYDGEHTPTHKMNGSEWQYEGRLPVYMDAYWKPVTPVPGKLPLISSEQVQARGAAGFVPLMNPASQYVFNYAGSLLFKETASGNVTDRFGVAQPENSVVFDEFGGPVRFFAEEGAPVVDTEGKRVFVDAYSNAVGYTLPNPFQEMIDELLANGYVELLNPTTGAAIINQAQLPLFLGTDGSVLTVAQEVCAA